MIACKHITFGQCRAGKLCAANMRKIVRCVQIRLSEIFQVEIHQSSVIVLILFCKKAEFVTFVESRCRSKCIDCHKTTSSIFSSPTTAATRHGKASFRSIT